MNCHFGRPNRAASSSATQSESSVGSRNWLPAAMRSATARTTGSGAYPQNMLISAMLKSEYSLPSTSVKRAPSPRATNSGPCAYELANHDMGTPLGMAPRARSSRARDRGRSATKRASSSSVSLPTTAGSNARSDMPTS